jgi:prolyl-tRNA synthetase
MNAVYLDVGGKSQVIEMGCYGIGISRTVQAAIEQCSDADGIAWPVPLAPFEVHICLLDPTDARSMEITNDLEAKLEAQGLSVIVDDRDERPGIKFKDADLIGMPLRIVVGKKGIEKNEIEIAVRATKEKLAKPISETVQFVASWVKERRV